MNSPYIVTKKVVSTRAYNPDYGDERVCICGHTYYRHFDSWEEMDACGCKYCECRTFIEAPGLDVKQVIVVRKDLKMGAGKLASQVAHASMAVILDYLGANDCVIADLPTDQPIGYWLATSFTKVVLYCDNEEHLRELQDKACNQMLPNALITDNGKTWFNGNATPTALAIGPWHSKIINLVTGDLKLVY